MSASKTAYVFFVAFSLVAALMLSVAPLPDFMQTGRPLWLALILAYWAFELPYGLKVMGVAWFMGLAQDVLYGAVFGMHALFLAFVVFAILNLRQRLRMFPQWQQALVLMLVLMIGQFFLLWLHQITGTSPMVSQYIFPALISGLLWPWVYMVMRFLHKTVRS